MMNPDEHNYYQSINEVLPGAQIIKCRGYINNSNYQKAKAPIESYDGQPSISELEIDIHLKKKGWIGAVIPKGYGVIDVDNKQNGQYLIGLLDGEHLNYHLIETPRGYQFIFKLTNEQQMKLTSISHYFSSIGVVVDTRIGGKNSFIVFPTHNTEERDLSRVSNGLSELPKYLEPVFAEKKPDDPNYFEFSIPMINGSRNTSLFKLGSKLKYHGVNDELIEKSLLLAYTYLCPDKKDISEREVQATINSIKNHTPKEKNDFQVYVQGEHSEQTMIPQPFFIKNGSLFRKVEKNKKNGETEISTYLVSRYTPAITRILEHIEYGDFSYQISWVANNRHYNEVVSANTVASKRELLTLSNRGFSVNDLNAKDLIYYFDLYLGQNNIEQSNMIHRLGWLGNKIIHPMLSEDIEVIPSEVGYKQLIESFETSGTLDSWKANVFDLIKGNPKALFMVLSSFTSTILKDLKLLPIIVDLTGSTSQGKSSVLSAAASVWGNEKQISEFNTTLNAIERKAAFLNCFPLLLDDHNKAPKSLDIEKLIYSYSGGQSKGRATISGLQQEYTWSNMMLCNGENALLDHVERAGGASARVISLQDFSFEEYDDFFSDLYTGIEENYGAAGIAFIDKWMERKQTFLPIYKEHEAMFRKLSNGNEVLTRLSRHFAAVYLVADFLNKVFDFEIDLMSLVDLFNDMEQETQSLNKPKQLLVEILQDLDSDRECVFYEYKPPRERKAVFRSGQLFLLPKYLKSFLGVEMKQTRKEWMKQGFTYELVANGNINDWKQIKHKGEKMQAVPLKMEKVKELGFDFEIEKCTS